MAISDIFKRTQNQSESDSLKQDCEKYKAELIALKQDYENLQMNITPEMQSALTLQQEISKLRSEQMQEQIKLDELKSTFASKNSELLNLEQTIQEKRTKIVWMDDEILVQEFGLYKPQYDFASALDYKDELAKIRALQKELIKNSKAVNGNPRWTIDGSVSKGNKMVYDTQKLLLRAFNAECDELVSKVRYTNFDASLNKIQKSAGAISKLGAIMGISINQYYLDAKIKELRLAFEYQLKKQQEKEEEKAARAEQREAAKLQKEIEEQRKKIEKEQTHYQTAYEKIKSQLSQHPDDADLIAKKAELVWRPIYI